MDSISDNIAAHISSKLDEIGCYLVNIKFKSPNKVQVYIDQDDGISINQCVAISRYHIPGVLIRIDKYDIGAIIHAVPLPSWDTNTNVWNAFWG